MGDFSVEQRRRIENQVNSRSVSNDGSIRRQIENEFLDDSTKDTTVQKCSSVNREKREVRKKRKTRRNNKPIRVERRCWETIAQMEISIQMAISKSRDENFVSSLRIYCVALMRLKRFSFLKAKNLIPEKFKFRRALES